MTRRMQIGSALAGMLFAAVFPQQCSGLDQTGFLRSHLQTRFTNEDGLPAGVIGDMVQSPDGFLWLVANGTALARFDGRHFTFFDEPRHVRALALGPDGDLWVATRDGLERIRLTAQKQFGNLPSIPYRLPAGTSKTVTCLYFSRDGVLWVGTNKGLDRLEGAGFATVIPGPAIVRIKEASGGRILAITAEEFIEWNGSLAVRHPEIAVQLGIEADKLFDVMEDRNGVTWFCTAKGVARQIGGSLVRIAPYGPHGHGALRAYEDPEGNVWITKADGLYRATTAGIELAVPGMQVRYVYGDRDGDLWVGTNGDGLYRFKTRAIRMFTTADGLPNNVVQTVLASSDGTLWTGANCGGISRFEGGRFQTYNEKDGLSNSCVWDLAEDINHDLWIGTYGGGAFRFHDGHFTQFSKAPGFPSDIVTSVLVAHDHSVWFATHGGLARMRDGRIRTYTVADGLSSNLVLRLLEDRTGVLWAGTNSGFDRLDGDRFIHFSPLSKNAVFPLGEDPSGIYIYVDYPTQEIVRFDKNRITSLTSDLKLLSTGMLRTEQGDSWLSGRSIVRLPPNALSQSRATDEPLDYAAFDLADGLPRSALCSGGHPNSAWTRDGKLWFATTQGLAMVDLGLLPKADGKPAIYLQAITFGRNSQFPSYGLNLPPGTHHVDLQFDAVEISSPEKIRLQYRLDGVDTEWLDAGYPAHAIYSYVPPGTHSFHIRATNRAGVWDRTGVVFAITQAPFLYQMRPFQFAAVALVIVLLAAAYYFRVRRLAAAMNVRFDERLAERTRIARDLHDTLLQSIEGSRIVADDALKHGTDPGRMERALKRLSGWLAQASEEGRSALSLLRSSTEEGNDLAHAFQRAGDECMLQRPIEFSVLIEGTAGEMHPIVRDEVYLIGYESIRNACSHSGASRLTVELNYREGLSLRVRDNGKGMDPNLAAAGKGGHFGMLGMYERAARIKGKLTISSSPANGTQVELVVPRSIAFHRPEPVRRSLSQKLTHLFKKGDP